MDDTDRAISDPARDLLRAIGQTQGAANSRAMWQALGALWNVEPWSDEFLLGLRLISGTIQEVEQHLLADEGKDADDENFVRQRIAIIRQWLSLDGLANNYGHMSRLGAALGPDTTTFLTTSSRMFRSNGDYYHPSAEDRDVMIGSIDEIIAALDGLTLERADYVREALIRGAREIRFILEHIDFFGYSKLIGPSAEISAFLHTLRSVESDESDTRLDWIAIGRAAKRYYGRIQQLEKAKKTFNFIRDSAGPALSYFV